MFQKVCHCCGGQIATSDQGNKVHICKDCERLTGDDSPVLTALALEALVVVEDEKSDLAPAAEEPKAPDATDIEEPKRDAAGAQAK